MVNQQVKQGIRVVQTLFVLIALSLVGAGSGLCIYFYQTTSCVSVTLSIGNWKNYDTSIIGQYFVFISSLLLLVATFINIIINALNPAQGKIIAICVAAVGGGLCLLNGSLEAWYATGWVSNNILKPARGYNQSWVAAIAFYFAAAILYIIDFVFTNRTAQ